METAVVIEVDGICSPILSHMMQIRTRRPKRQRRETSAQVNVADDKPACGRAYTCKHSCHVTITANHECSTKVCPEITRSLSCRTGSLCVRVDSVFCLITGHEGAECSHSMFLYVFMLLLCCLSNGLNAECPFFSIFLPPSFPLSVFLGVRSRASTDFLA